MEPIYVCISCGEEKPESEGSMIDGEFLCDVCISIEGGE